MDYPVVLPLVIMSFWAPGISQILDENRLSCRICDHATTLADCKQVAICDARYEDCYMDQVVTPQQTIVYNGGCRAKDVCEGNGLVPVGRKRATGELISCKSCCNDKTVTDGCNKRLCGIPAPSAGNQCYACSSDQFLSSQGDVLDPSDCVSLKSCQRDEVCYARTHVSGTTVSYEYGCNHRATCQLLMERTMEDRQRCETASTDGCGMGLSQYCFTCCAWGACNYGTCLEQNDRLYELFKLGLFDPRTLTYNSTSSTGK